MMDDLKDNKKFLGNDIYELLVNLNPNFILDITGHSVTYKHRLPLYIINYEPYSASDLSTNIQEMINLNAIKSIYISENITSLMNYADPRSSKMDVLSTYSCVVFIETFLDGNIPAKAGKGIRKTWIDGYNKPDEFYIPDYSYMPKENDYRRTLYWNPNLTPNEDGFVEIKFYNNSNSNLLKINAETISNDGKIGVFIK